MDSTLDGDLLERLSGACLAQSEDQRALLVASLIASTVCARATGMTREQFVWLAGDMFDTPRPRDHWAIIARAATTVSSIGSPNTEPPQGDGGGAISST